jgi:hypothetical protein
VCLKAFQHSWDDVHQFVEGDGNISMPNPVTDAPGAIADILRPGGAILDFVWGGDGYANCWAGNATCHNLPANQQHPIVGHYVSFTGVRMLAGYARCVDNTECSPFGYVCEPLRITRRADFNPAEFKAQITETINTYLDGDGNPEKVCLPVGHDTPSLTAPQAKFVEFNYWHRAHPGWLLYRKPDDTSHYNPDNPATKDMNEEKTTDSVAWISGSLPLDVSNPDVVKEIFGRIEHWPHLQEYYGAISLDTVGLANYFGAHYRCNTTSAQGCKDWRELEYNGVKVTGNNRYGPEDKQHVPLCPDGGYCDPAWRELVLNWVAQVRNKAHSLGLNLVVNVSYGGDKTADPYVYIPASDPKLLQLFDNVDGVFDEGGFTGGHLQADKDGCLPIWSYDGDYKCSTTKAQSRWSNFSGYLRAVQARGKPYFSKNTSPGPVVYPVDPQLEARAIPWAVASFLMSRATSASNALQAIYMSEANLDLGWVPYDTCLYNALSPDIGHPCEDPQSPQANVFARQFSGGLVMVNANAPGGAAAIITLPMLANVTWPATAPTSLAAESGAVILVKNGNLCK